MLPEGENYKLPKARNKGENIFAGILQIYLIPTRKRDKPKVCFKLSEREGVSSSTYQMDTDTGIILYLTYKSIAV